MNSIAAHADGHSRLVRALTSSRVDGPGRRNRYRQAGRTAATARRAEDCDPRIDELGSRPLVSGHHCDEALVDKPRITVTSAVELAAALTEAL